MDFKLYALRYFSSRLDIYKLFLHTVDTKLVSCIGGRKKTLCAQHYCNSTEWCRALLMAIIHFSSSSCQDLWWKVSDKLPIGWIAAADIDKFSICHFDKLTILFNMNTIGNFCCQEREHRNLADFIQTVQNVIFCCCCPPTIWTKIKITRKVQAPELWTHFLIAHVSVTIFHF